VRSIRMLRTGVVCVFRCSQPAKSAVHNHDYRKMVAHTHQWYSRAANVRIGNLTGSLDALG